MQIINYIVKTLLVSVNYFNDIKKLIQIIYLEEYFCHT